jgi:hypothetical protein
LCAAKLKAGATELVIASEELVPWLMEFDPYWANEYRGSDGRPGEITKRKLAALWGLYEIHPQLIHPTKRAEKTRGGYRILARGKWDETWLDRLARYCPGLPDIQTLGKPDRAGRKTGT